MRRAWLAIPACAIAVGAISALSRAQDLDTRRPMTLVVGAPRGASPTDRVNAHRDGRARDPLPTGRLKVAWRRSLGVAIEHAPIVDAQGNVTVVTSRGDVVTLSPSGDEIARASLGVTAATAPALTSDGTVVFVTTTGEAVAVRGNAVRYRTRIGASRGSESSPLALDDGGVAVAAEASLATLDSSGGIRARAELSEPIGAPLLALAGQVLAITRNGVVYAWTPGREPVRSGSFEGPIDGAACAIDDHTLLAVVGGDHLAELDWTRGVSATRASAATGIYLGPPAAPSRSVSILAMTTGKTFVLTLDAQGQETGRAAVASWSPQTLADGGAAPLVAPAHAGPITDAAGTVAFATPDGAVGIVSPQGAVDSLGEPVCTRGAGRTNVEVGGLAPAGPHRFAVSCESGAVAVIEGD